MSKHTEGARSVRDPWARLTTEATNPLSAKLDRMSALAIAQLIAREDRKAIEAVSTATKTIAQVARRFCDAIVGGGNVYYVGAGTSGRLGVIDAAELVPTFSLPRSGAGSAKGFIAGGLKALAQSVEGAEDDVHAGAKVGNLAQKGDLVIGISASSLAPYVRAALIAAKENGAATSLVTMNKIKRPPFVDFLIAVRVGPEVLAGSTRMKSGLATKSVLHNISTTAMVLAGKVLGNQMVDLKTWCSKLEARGQRLISTIGNVPPPEAEQILKSARGDVKAGIVMARRKIGRSAAIELLRKSKGDLRRAIE